MSKSEHVTVSQEQAALLVRAIQQRDTAQQALTVTLAAMTAGLVPDGAVLSGLDVATGVLTFTGAGDG